MKLIALAVLLIPVTVPAHADDVAPILLKTLAPLVRKTIRPVVFYSYGTRTPRTPEQFFRDVAGGHFGTTRQDQELGNGLYTDADPLATLDYSGNPPQVLRVAVPAGVRYLDERDHFRAIPATEEEATRIAAYLRASCPDDKCRESLDADERFARESKSWPSYDPKRFLYLAGPQKVLQSAYARLGIEFIAGGFGLYDFPECKLDAAEEFETEAVFIDPALAPRLQLDLLTPRPDPARRAIYADFLAYFDAFSFERDLAGTSFDPARNGAKSAADTKARFMSWYSGILPLVHPEAKGQDPAAFQKKLSDQLAATRAERLTARLFGCSPEPAFRDEAFPPR